MDDIKNTPGWGMPDDFINRLDNARGKQRTSLEEMRDVLDSVYCIIRAMPISDSVSCRSLNPVMPIGDSGHADHCIGRKRAGKIAG